MKKFVGWVSYWGLEKICFVYLGWIDFIKNVFEEIFWCLLLDWKWFVDYVLVGLVKMIEMGLDEWIRF